MKTAFFYRNTVLNSDTYYIFGDKTLTVQKSDTKRTENKKYLSANGNGNYGFLDVAFYLYRLKNVTLDFGGAIITFCGRIQPFIIDECENISIKNVIIRYDRAFFSEFDILKKSYSEMILKTSKAFACRTENGGLIPYSDTWEDHTLNRRAQWLQGFDKKTHEGKGACVVVIGKEDDKNEPHPTAVPNRLTAREENGNIVLSGNCPVEWDESIRVCLAHEIRDKSGVAIYSSKDIQIENFRILNGAGMGFLAVYTENISLNKIKFFCDDLSDGIITNAADGIHFVSCFGKISITDSIFEGMIDDALNIHSNFYHATNIKHDSFVADATKTLHAFNGALSVFSIGDTIAVYNGDTFEEKERIQIKNIHRLDSSHMEIVTEQPILSASDKDMIENLSAYPELVIKNCCFDKTNTHLRIQTRKKTLISNCTASIPICLTGDTHVWYESGNASDITICNCDFKSKNGMINIIPECNLTSAVPYYHGGIKIFDNTFESGHALYAMDTDGIEFYKNSVKSAADFALELKNCRNVFTDLE